jgi:hypothetical protein
VKQRPPAANSHVQRNNFNCSTESISCFQLAAEVCNETERSPNFETHSTPQAAEQASHGIAMLPPIAGIKHPTLQNHLEASVMREGCEQLPSTRSPMDFWAAPASIAVLQQITQSYTDDCPC